MSWLIQFVVALVVLLFGVSAFATAGTGWVKVSGEGYSGVIVTPDAAEGFGTGVDEVWIPSESDVAVTEAAIAEVASDLDQNRQYAGVIEDGEHKVFVNGLCNDFGNDWRTRLIVVDDGGDCYFRALYTLDREELEYFVFNGQA